MDQLTISHNKKLELLRKQWVLDLPNKSDDLIQTLYVPDLLKNNDILVFGPIKLPWVGIYQPYIIFIFALLLIEFIIFIIAIMFSRSLDKLNKLANNYGQGNFENDIRLNKTSNLYPLFRNLKSMGDRIKKLLDSHKELINTVSHELRTPISRLRFSLELLRESKTNDQVKNRSDAMEADIVELEDLVAEILSYAQFDRVEPNFGMEKIYLNQLLNKAIEVIQKNKFVISSPDDIWVNVNEKYILRALQNLLQNADRFANSLIRVNVIKLNDKNCQIIIEDDGPGILEEDRERVFHPFVQLNNQKDTPAKNYGLGLALTKKIVDQHMWQISIVDSALGGAKFVLTFSMA